jgi:uncharacterized protein YcnI
MTVGRRSADREKELHVIHRMSARIAGAVLATLSLLIATTAPVAAHVTIVDGSTVPSGGSAVIHFRVPHGCDGQPVDTLTVQLPEGIVGAKPMAMAGWTTTTEMVPADYELYGTRYTERVGTIRWEGGPLPDNEFLDFAVRATFQLEPGAYTIPVVQGCGAASEAWIEVAAEGQDPDELEHPAPVLTVVASDGGDGHGGGATTDVASLAADLAAANERIAALEAAPVAEASTTPNLALTLAALVAGLGGLLLGAAALRRGR